MMHALQIILSIALVFIALGIACAMWIGRRRHPPADPFSVPFGEMPIVDLDAWRRRTAAGDRRGFTSRELTRIAPPVVTRDPLRRSFAPRDGSAVHSFNAPLRENSAGVALRPADAGSGWPKVPSGLEAVRDFFLMLIRSSRARARYR